MLSIACKLQPNYICATGLIPYILRFFMTGSIPCLLISTNGLVFHVFYHKNVFVKWVDTITNIILIIHINIQAYNAYVFMWSCFGIGCFMVNVPIKDYELMEPLIHVTCVQFSGFVCMVLSGF
jgi:hypothetical protein